MPQNNYIPFLSLLLILFQNIDCFQWSQVQESSHVISSYLGSNVTLPCEFLLSAQENQQMQQFHVVLWSRQTSNTPALHYWQALASITNINNALDSSPKIIYPDQNKFSMKNNSLAVFSVAMEDDAEYQCEVKSSFYTTPSKVKLNVLYRPHETQLIASKTTVATNTGFELNCTARANPKAGYSFFLDGKMVQNSSSHQYIISKAAESNGGEYVCIPWNFYGDGPNATVIIKVGGLQKTSDESSFSDEVIAGITGAVALAVIIIVVIAIICKRLRDDKKPEPEKSTSTPRKPSDLREAHNGPGMYGSEDSINKGDENNYNQPSKLCQLKGSPNLPYETNI